MLTTKREPYAFVLFFGSHSGISSRVDRSWIRASPKAVELARLCVWAGYFCHLVNVFARNRTDNVKRARTKPRHG